jgi:putative ABC transport system permease protein
VIEFMALFTAGTAVVVLVGAVFAGRQQRRREIVLLRTLGATRRQLAQIQAVEYAVLGVLAATVGALLAWLASALLARFVFSLTTAAPPVDFAIAIAAVTAITLCVGWIADRGLTRLSPLEALRAEG